MHRWMILIALCLVAPGAQAQKKKGGGVRPGPTPRRHFPRRRVTPKAPPSSTLDTWNKRNLPVDVTCYPANDRTFSFSLTSAPTRHKGKSTVTWIADSSFKLSPIVSRRRTPPKGHCVFSRKDPLPPGSLIHIGYETVVPMAVTEVTIRASGGNDIIDIGSRDRTLWAFTKRMVGSLRNRPFRMQIKRSQTPCTGNCRIRSSFKLVKIYE